jgi:hypothetical protein
VERQVVVLLLTRGEERLDVEGLCRGGRGVAGRCESSAHYGAGQRLPSHVLCDLPHRVALVGVVVDGGRRGAGRGRASWRG